MIKFKEGNLITLAQEGKYDIILHGVNCHCKMSDGLALEMAKNFPKVQESDLKTIPLDKSKLGTFIAVPITLPYKTITILNCYTQFNYAGYDLEDSVLFDYQAFETILNNVAQQYRQKKIGMPLIGTGHALGNQDRIIGLIKQYLSHHDVDIIIYGQFNQPKELHSWINKIKCWIN